MVKTTLSNYKATPQSHHLLLSLMPPDTATGFPKQR